MKKIYSLFSVLIMGSFMANAQYCEPVITNNCVTGAPETILNVTFQEINNTTGCIAGINDYTDMIANVEAGNSYDITFEIEADPGFPDDYVLAYIDWNQNFDFSDPGEFYHLAGPTGTSGVYNSSIAVPNDAAMGETRMRIVVNWNQPDFDGCTTMNYGEIEDYTINVGVVGMDENSIAGFTYFPNPVSDILNLKAAVSMDDVTVFNLKGQQVLKQSIDANTGQLNVNQLEAGLYLMQVTSEGVTATFQVVKK